MSFSEKYRSVQNEAGDGQSGVNILSAEQAVAIQGVTRELGALQKLSAPANFPGFVLEESQFEKDYGPDMVSASRKLAFGMRSKHSEKAGDFAAVAETIPLLGNTISFLGKDYRGREIEMAIYRVPTSANYDWPFADLVFEIKNNAEGSLAKKYGDLETITRFMVDVTTADEGTVRDKVERAENSFSRGYLHDLHYFRSNMSKLAKIGLSNVPNLILAVSTEALVDFLRKVRPHIDAERAVVTNKEAFEADYHKFASGLINELRQQAADQTKAFAAECVSQRIITREEYDSLAQMIDGREHATVEKFVSRIKDREAGRPDLPSGGGLKRVDFMNSLRKLTHTVASLDLVQERRSPATTGLG